MPPFGRDVPPMAKDLSHILPPSLGSLFGQAPEPVERAPVKASPPASIPGAFNAPELCSLLEGWTPGLHPARAGVEVKLDGIRCLYIAGQLYTREGSPMECASHCLAWLRGIEANMGTPMFFDGEYVEEGGLEATLSAFRSRKGNGCLWLFDAVPLDQWKSGKPSRAILRDRKEKLRKAVKATTAGRSDCAVGYIEHVDIGRDQVEDECLRLTRLGYEGLVIKNLDAPYFRKRNSEMLKVKLRCVSKLLVVDVAGCRRNGREEAKALIVRLPGKHGQQAHSTIKVPVPAGGAAETAWRVRADLIGEMVDVEHCGFTGAGNPREAVLKTLRF